LPPIKFFRGGGGPKKRGPKGLFVFYFWGALKNTLMKKNKKRGKGLFAPKKKNRGPMKKQIRPSPSFPS